MIKSILFLAICLTDVCRAVLNKTPENVVVLRGNPVTLQCEYNGPSIRWLKHGANLTGGYEIVYTGTKVRNSAMYSTDGSGSSLKINTTNTTAAGTYVCDEPGSAMRSRAELVIMNDNDLTCGCFEKNDHMVLWCSIFFRGNWAPMMEWKWNDNKPLPSKMVTNQTIPNSKINYTATVPIDQSTNGKKLVCTTRFQLSMKNSLTNATNLPDYTRTWTSPVLIYHEKIQTTLKPAIDEVKTSEEEQPYESSLVMIAIAAVCVGLILIAVTGLVVHQKSDFGIKSCLSWVMIRRPSPPGPDVYNTASTKEFANAASNDGDRQSDDSYDEDEFSIRDVGAEGGADYCNKVEVNLERTLALRAYQNGSGVVHNPQPAANVHYAEIDHTMRPPKLPPRRPSHEYSNHEDHLARE